jgi:hypothetical protein
MRQGDTHWAGSPTDGVISRQQIAQVLVASLTSQAATDKTFELVANPAAISSPPEAPSSAARAVCRISLLIATVTFSGVPVWIYLKAWKT